MAAEFGQATKDLTTSSRHRRAYVLGLTVKMFMRAMEVGGDKPDVGELLAYADRMDGWVENGQEALKTVGKG